jgi:hypothetical protein
MFPARQDRSARIWEVALFGASLAVCSLAAFAVLFTSPAAYAEFAARERVDLRGMRAPGWADQAFGGGIEITWYASAILVELHRQTHQYLMGVAPALPASPTRGAFYSQPGQAQLEGVRDALIAGRTLVLACVIVLGVICVGALRRGAIGSLLRGGGLAAAVAGMVLGAVALVFEPVVAGDSNLIALYPQAFVHEATLRSALSLLALTSLFAVVGRTTSIASHGASSGAPHPDRPLAQPRVGARR